MIMMLRATFSRTPRFFVSSLIAVTVATALLCFVNVGAESAIRSAEDRVSAKGFGTSVAVSRASPVAVIDDDMVRMVTQISGVQDVEVQYHRLGVGGPSSQDVSVFSSPNPLNRPGLSSGVWPGEQEAAITAQTAQLWQKSVGDQVAVMDQNSQTSRQFTIVGIVHPDGHAAAAVSGPVIFLPKVTFSSVFVNAKPSSLGIRTDSAVSVQDELRQRLSQDFRVLDRSAMVAKAVAERRVAASFLAATLGVLGWASLLSALTVIATSFRYSLVARRRQFVLLRILGANRGHIFWSIFTEAFAIGVVGAVVGALLGTFGCWAVIVNPWAGNPFAATSFQLPGVTLLWPMLLGVIFSVVAVLGIAFAAAKVGPEDGLHAGGVTDGRSKLRPVWVGFRWLLVGLAVALLWSVTQTSADILIIFSVLFVTCVLFAVIGRAAITDLLRVGTFVFKRLGAHRFPLPYVTVNNVASNPRSVASTIAGLAVSVGVITAIITAASTYIDYARMAANHAFPFHAVGVSAHAVDEQRLRDLQETPGVAQVVTARSVMVDLPHAPKTPLTAVSPDVFPNSGSSSWWRELKDDTLYVSSWVGFPRGIDGAPKTMVVQGATGAVTLNVVETDRVPGALGLLVSPATAASLGSVSESVVLVKLDSSATQLPAVGGLPAWDQVVLRPAFPETEDFLRTLGTVVSATKAVILIGVLVALVGIANALYMAVRQRSRTIALMRSLGASARLCLIAVVLEAVALAVVALLLAVPLGGVLGAGLAQLLVAAELVPAADRFAVTAVFDVQTTVVLAVVVVVCAVAAAVLPARAVLRITPGHGLTT